MKNNFEDFMAIASQGSEKVASDFSETGLLAKLAAEIGVGEAAPMAAAGDPDGVAHIPAASSIVGANPAVIAATEAVTAPMILANGGNPQEAMMGEMPGQIKPNEGIVISAGDGRGTMELDNKNITPSASVVAPIAPGVPATEEEKTAAYSGRVMARAYVEEMNKIAADQEYAEALEFAKEAGLLDNYDIADDFTKEASYQESGLEKIASDQELTRDDIITAAYEYDGLEKEAAYAEDLGREAAHEDLDELEKEAAYAEDLGREAAHEEVAELEKEAAYAEDLGREAAHEEVAELEKEAALIEAGRESAYEEVEAMSKEASDSEAQVANAVALLQSHGII